jgi:hypothetical protein
LLALVAEKDSGALHQLAGHFLGKAGVMAEYLTSAQMPLVVVAQQVMQTLLRGTRFLLRAERVQLQGMALELVSEEAEAGDLGHHQIP